MDAINAIVGAIVLLVLFPILSLGSIVLMIIAPFVGVYLIFRTLGAIIDGIQAIKSMHRELKREICTGNDELYAALYGLWKEIYGFKDLFVDVWNGKRSLWH